MRATVYLCVYKLQVVIAILKLLDSLLPFLLASPSAIHLTSPHLTLLSLSSFLSPLFSRILLPCAVKPSLDGAMSSPPPTQCSSHLIQDRFSSLPQHLGLRGKWTQERTRLKGLAQGTWGSDSPFLLFSTECHTVLVSKPVWSDS